MKNSVLKQNQDGTNFIVSQTPTFNDFVDT
jgi:hypothetical protein